MRTLQRTHPLSCLLYMAAVLGITIFTRNPLMMAESLAGAALLLLLCGKGKFLLAALPTVLLCAVTNPLFSHSGDTVLFFIGNAAYTLEALVYGGIFGGMLAAVCGWGIAAAEFVTSDKYIWLFGSILPVCGLVLSCSLRLIPLLLRTTRDFTAASGEDSLRGRLSAFSASLGYSAEQAMSSADSMRARGYGCAKRTSYSIYHLGGRELMQLAAVVISAAACIIAMISGGGEYRCYPALSPLYPLPKDMVLYLAFGVLCLLPCAAIVWEQLKRQLGCRRLKEH